MIYLKGVATTQKLEHVEDLWFDSWMQSILGHENESWVAPNAL